MGIGEQFEFWKTGRIGPEGKRFVNYYHTNSKTQKLHDQPHYTEELFKEAQVVFGVKEDGLDYVYSDRLQQWDYKKSDLAWKTATESGLTPRTAAHYEKYLSEYYGKDIELVCVMAGYNLSNSYPYQVFGYKEK